MQCVVAEPITDPAARAALDKVRKRAKRMHQEPTAGTTRDLTGTEPVTALPGGPGPWFVLLPTPAAAGAARPVRRLAHCPGRGNASRPGDAELRDPGVHGLPGRGS